MVSLAFLPSPARLAAGRRFFLWAIAATLLANAALRCHGQTLWTDGVGDWFNPVNWSLGVPTPVINARIGNGGTAQIFAPNAEVQQLMLGAMGGERGTLTIINSGSLLRATTLILGDAGSGTLNITDGADLNAGTVTLANSGGTGAATISGPGTTLNTSGVLTVGRGGNGNITIDAGAVATSPNVQLGSGIGGFGTAIISGASSRWNVSEVFLVGGAISGGTAGFGSLMISAGALVDATNPLPDVGRGEVRIGFQSGSTGVVTVTGAGSTLMANYLIQVGGSGQGTLTVSDGGLVQSGGTSIGSFNGATGTMLVTGGGSRLEDTNEVTVGNFMGSTGTLAVAEGGTVDILGGTGVLRIAADAGSTGTVNIGNGGAPGVLSAGSAVFGAGAGALNFNHTGFLLFDVPISGPGAVNKLGAGDTVLLGVNTFAGPLLVRGGSVQLAGTGEIHNVFGSIGVDFGETAAVVVHNGSRWTTTSSLHIGARGDGLLHVEDGGVVDVGGEILIERFAEGRGELVVTGARAQVSSAFDLRVADEGLGILRVENGGLLTTRKGFLAPNAATANATVTITGADSRWDIANEINVGGFGDATVTISDGGALTSGSNSNYIGGYDANGSGLVTVTGAGSQWTLGGYLNVGGTGQGELRVQDGGAVSGTGLGVAGNLVVDGAGSALTMSDYLSISGSTIVENDGALSSAASLQVGGSSSAALTIRTGGMLTSDVGFHHVGGFGPSTSALVTVTDAGSAWTLSDNLNVGYFGPGEVRIENGATVSSTGSAVGLFGTLSVIGAGSALTIPGVVIIEGVARVQAGGTVSNLPPFGYGLGLGASNPNVALLEIDGVDSRWNSADFVGVGYFGAGNLTIHNGGVMNDGRAYLGFGSTTSPGTAIVEGTGSAWNHLGNAPDGSDGFLVVGNEANATLTIRDGAVVTTEQTNVRGAEIAALASSTAIVTVSGAGSAWMNAGDVIVGNAGKATLNIEDGANVIVGEGNGTVTLGAQNKSDGTLNIGTGGAPGTLDAGSVVFGPGEGVRTLAFNHTGDVTFDASISGPGSVSKSGPGTTTLTAASSYTGTTLVAAGTLRITEQTGQNLGDGWNPIFPGGTLEYAQNGRGGNQTAFNLSGSDGNSTGGRIVFRDTASAGSLNLSQSGTNFPSSAAQGATEFHDSSTAEAANITNYSGATIDGGVGGDLLFFDSATAGGATITNLPGEVSGAGGGRTSFRNHSTAGSAQIENRGTTVADALPGKTEFLGDATAGAATIVNKAPTAAGAAGGRTEFRDSATGGTAAITIETEGLTQFLNMSSAGSATFTLQRGNTVGLNPGLLYFIDDATAASAIITVAPGSSTVFYGTSDAGSATFINQGETVEGSGGFGGGVFFAGNATAMNGTITNGGSSVAGSGPGFSNFTDDSSAGEALITSQGGLVAGAPGGFSIFSGDAHGDSATITAEGSDVTGGGGAVFFVANTSAENAILTASGGNNGGEGGNFLFSDNASGGNARWIAEGNGLFDISFLAGSGTTAGSITGSGSFLLGAKNLTVGGNNTSTVVSGSISGNGGSLTKVGTGTLTLSGVNSYTGSTFVNDGRLLVNSALPGTVNVNNGSLAGAGPLDGGARIGNFAGSEQAFLDPGARVGTMTVTSALSFTPLGAYRWELDSDAVQADSIIATDNVFLNFGGNGRLIPLDLGTAALPLGFSFTILDKQSAGAISDIFFDLPEGAEFDLGANRFRVSYVGGDGNDLVLTNTIPEPGGTPIAFAGAAVLLARRLHRPKAWKKPAQDKRGTSAALG